jgi:hypothetical protein
MHSYRLILLLGLILAVGAGLAGFTFFKREDFLLNLTSEAVGVLVGGLVVFALLELHRQRGRDRDLQKAREELFHKLYWELELLQFSVRPLASWSVGLTYGEEVQALINQAGHGPLPAAYFLEIVERLVAPLASLSMEATPRVISLIDDRDLVPAILRLEQTGRKIQAAAHSRSEASPESHVFRDLIDDFLRQAGVVGDCVDRLLHGENIQDAAQARFDRLRPLGLSESWSSDNRKVYEQNGEPYQPGV